MIVIASEAKQSRMTVLTTKDTKITKLFFSVIFLCDLYELYDEKTNFFSKFTIIFKKLRVTFLKLLLLRGKKERFRLSPE
ncbi:MAG TPA: hypothetical protein DCM27_00370 [Rhodospirillaceae bacterium]|nr:hypothetical protein [Rhodospirillaceae bacterium]